jgi:hypothetical protein
MGGPAGAFVRPAARAPAALLAIHGLGPGRYLATAGHLSASRFPRLTVILRPIPPNQPNNNLAEFTHQRV